MVQKYRSDFSGVVPLEIQIRLIELSDDPDAVTIRRDLIALRGIIAELNEARLFRTIKECFINAGAQPALQQICRQQLETFTKELLSSKASRFRDIKADAVRRRLRTVAMSDQVGFSAGDSTAFESLRDIRKAQREKRDAGRIAMAKASPYYCQPSRRKGSPRLAAQLAGQGICICFLWPPICRLQSRPAQQPGTGGVQAVRSVGPVPYPRPERRSAAAWRLDYATGGPWRLCFHEPGRIRLWQPPVCR